ncbi:hypothetical protein ABZX30_35945 [Streptomyces sp. NPDC004542]
MRSGYEGRTRRRPPLSRHGPALVRAAATRVATLPEEIRATSD